MAESRQRSHLTRNLIVGFLILVVFYALAGFLLLPWWIERAIPEQLAQRMGWQAEVESVRVNPFAFSVETLGLSARDTEGKPVVGFDRMFLDLGFFQLVRGIVGFQTIQLQEPFIRLDLLEDYSVNFARDWQNHNPPSDQPVPEDQAKEADSEPPKFYFQQIVVDGGELMFRDFSQKTPAEFKITPLDLTLNDLATWRRDGRDSDYSVLAVIGSQTIEWEGDLSVAPLYSKGSLSIVGVGSDTLKHFLSPYLPYDLRGGRVTLRSDYELQAGDLLYLTTRNGTLLLDDLAVAIDEQSEEPRLTSSTIAADQIGFDLNTMEVRVGQVSLEELDAALTRDESGIIDWLAPLSATDGDSQGPATESASETAEGSQPVRWSVEGVSASNSRVHWQDRQPGTAADLTLEQLSLSSGRMSDRLEEPVTYQANATLASGGRLSLNGQVTPQPFTLEAAISGSDVALAAFEPYMQEGANLAIGGGRLTIDGNLDLDGQQAPLTGTFSGTAEIAGFSLRLPGTDDQMVSWNSLRLAPIEYNVNPARLEIGTVTLSRPVVNVIRGSDNIHNLQRVARTGESPGTGMTSAPPSDNRVDGEADFIFRIGQLMLEDGSVAYTDRTLNPAVTTSFDALTGSVTGLSNIPPQQGKVSISGRVGQVATVDFRGTIGTLGTEDVSDLKLTMNDLSLPVLSPYFGRYVGYGVDSGKLNLKLDYKIAGTRIDASNLVVMDRLELGKPIASQEAVNAPVKLGLALLRDRDGMIEVDLPVSGDLSDPDFSVGKVAMRAFVNLLAKAAASPFSMLGSIVELAGLSGDELGEVSFQPGSIELAEGEPAKLAALADALLERPNLLLNIRGGIAPEADGLALLRDELTSGGTKALSGEAWAAARKDYLDGERELAPEALNNLATARGIAIRKVLQDTHEVPADQLFLLEPSRSAAVNGSGEVTVGLTLDVR